MANNQQATLLIIDNDLHQIQLNEWKMEREVWEILTNIEYKQLDQPLDSPPTTQYQKWINKTRERWFDTVPYGLEDLIYLVDSA